MKKLPLEGIRVIDSTYVFAMPYAAGILTDLGAEVIKIEGPGHIDNTRGGAFAGAYPDNDPGVDPWNRTVTFNQLNRGKKSLTLDLSKEEGREALKELIKVSDIVIENFTPRVMRRWELDYPNMRKIKPDVIMVSNTGYGHGEGPYSQYPGQATTQEATHGHTSVTGYRGDIASKVGQSYIDFLACWSSLLGIALALRHRNRTGKGLWLEIGMYQLGPFWLGEYVMDWMVNDRKGQRLGNRHPWRAPQGCYPCDGENQWCVISVGDDVEWAALCHAMGKPELVEDARFVSTLKRVKYHDEIDEIIKEWTSRREKFDVMELLQAVGVPAGPVFDARDTNLNSHYKERGFLEVLQYPEDRHMGKRVLMGRPWRLSKLPVNIRGPAPKLGDHNREMLIDLLGYEEAQYNQLEEAGIISDRPTNPRPLPTMTLDELVKSGRLDYFDPDFKQKLGI